jgi:hypothetical protein
MIIRSHKISRSRSASPSILASVLALALSGASGCDEPPPNNLPSTYTIPGDAVYPEGITADAERGTYYVSSLATGAVFRGNLNQANASVFLQPGQDGRTVSLGLNLDRTRNRLFVSGGATGLAFVYDTNNGQLLGRFSTGVTPSTDPNAPTTFVNDVVVLPNGDAYFTDSIVPTLFRLPASAIGQGTNTQPLEAWLNFNGTAFAYQSGTDLISLIVAQTNTGKLFRITVATQQVTEITGVNVPGGDGLVVNGTTLYAVHMQTPPIVRINMAADFSSGTDSPLPSQPTGLLAPTTAALAGNRLLVVNSQIDRLFGGTAPVTPFTVTAVTLP